MPKRDKQSDIPVGTQFSADLIDLKAFAKAAVEHSGEKEALMTAVWAAPIRKRDFAPPTRRKRSLPLEAAVQYGILTPGSYEATELARDLAEASEEDLPTIFARHILLNRGGLRVLQGIEEMNADRRPITGDTLAQFLSDQGFRVTVHNTAINTLRQWLGEAGIFPRSRGDAWQVNAAARDRVLGLPGTTIGVLSGMTQPQVEFVKALCRVDPPDWCRASDIRDNAEAHSAIRFDRSSLPNEVLRTLQDAGIIEFDSGGTAGGKASRLKTTDLFKKDILKPFVEHTIQTLDPVSAEYYRKRPSDIFSELHSQDTYVKGTALEALAVYVMRLLGLRFVAWRKRAADTTGGSEVDALLAGVFGSLPTKWQVQCKNTKQKVDLEDVAKEVGLVPLTKATHILIFTVSDFTDQAREYAERIMDQGPLTIFLLNKDDMERIRQSPSEIGSILRDQANKILSRRKAVSVWWD